VFRLSNQIEDVTRILSEDNPKNDSDFLEDLGLEEKD
jgi:hypothetical protein